MTANHDDRDGNGNGGDSMGPPIRTGTILNVMISVFAFIGMTISGWVASSLQGLKETTLRQEGTNALISEKLNQMAAAIDQINKDGYSQSDAARDWLVQKAVNQALEHRIEELEHTVHPTKR